MILVQIILQKHKSQTQQGVFVCPRACLSVCLCLCLCMYVCMYARTCSVCARVCVCASEWRRVRAIITILFHAYSSSTVFLTNNTNLVPRTMLVKIILFREHRLSCKKKKSCSTYLVSNDNLVPSAFFEHRLQNRPHARKQGGRVHNENFACALGELGLPDTKERLRKKEKHNLRVLKPCFGLCSPRERVRKKRKNGEAVRTLYVCM